MRSLSSLQLSRVVVPDTGLADFANCLLQAGVVSLLLFPPSTIKRSDETNNNDFLLEVDPCKVPQYSSKCFYVQEYYRAYPLTLSIPPSPHFIQGAKEGYRHDVQPGGSRNMERTSKEQDQDAWRADTY